MLLAVMDLIQAGHITSNKILFNQALKERFTHHFENVAQNNDRDTPENPYFHLKSEGFWHLAYHPGFDAHNTKRYASKAITYAYLDDELFSYMKSYIVSNELKEALVSNLSDLPTLFHQWLMDIGKSDKTAINYLTAIRGSISNWLMDAGEIAEPLTNLKSYYQFVTLEQKVRNMEIFKLRDSKGKGMYSAALSHYQQFLADLSKIDINADIQQVMRDKTLTETEKEILIKTRVGQGQFRANLVDMWGGCAVTGYRNRQMLLASHIKPWRDATNEERLDRYNGLLLLANLDKAFDLGFISFNDSGKVLISKYLEHPEVLGINDNMSFHVMREHKKYLAYHRGMLFKGL
ncbi:restriction endonuclease [Photobacterium aphoticum]|nr:restriction endonuclease [Photobacterium aphoticum]